MRDDRFCYSVRCYDSSRENVKTIADCVVDNDKFEYEDFSIYPFPCCVCVNRIFYPDAGVCGECGQSGNNKVKEAENE